MSEFTREYLTRHGVPEDQLDAIMAGANRMASGRLAGFVPQADVERRIQEALDKAARPEPADPTDSEAYRALAAERDMLRAIGGAQFEGVKPKFREQVFAMLDRSEGARPVAEQLEGIRRDYEEYFVGESEKRRPQFGAPVEGSMPRGDVGAVQGFSDAWGFVPQVRATPGYGDRQGGLAALSAGPRV